MLLGGHPHITSSICGGGRQVFDPLYNQRSFLATSSQITSTYAPPSGRKIAPNMTSVLPIWCDFGNFYEMCHESRNLINPSWRNMWMVPRSDPKMDSKGRNNLFLTASVSVASIRWAFWVANPWNNNPNFRSARTKVVLKKLWSNLKASGHFYYSKV